MLTKIFTGLCWLLALPLFAQPFFPGLEGQELIDAIEANFRPGSVYDYDTARDTLYGKIDRRNDSLYCVYTNFGVQLTPGEDPSSDAFQQGLNTEHTWPRSKGASSGFPNSDMHHLFSTREQVNSDRASLPFGEVNDNSANKWYYLANTTTSTPNTSIRDLYSELQTNQRFEPREAHKGNVARAMFYFWTVYRDEAMAADPNFFPPQISTLCNWHEQDPVDSRELIRTEEIALRQDGKVNPFVVDCNLLTRSYCPNNQPVSCLSSVAEVFGQKAPFSVLGVGRDINRLPYVMLSFEEAARLEVDWFDMLGRKVSFEGRDWLSAGTFQLSLTNEVARSATGGDSPLVARIRILGRGGEVFLQSVLVP